MPSVVIDEIKFFFRVLRDGIEVPSVKSNYPSILVLHGGPGIVDHQIEYDAWKRFSDNHQVIYLDQRGSGRSDDGDPSDWNLKRCGRDIKEFCDALGVLNPVVAGVSWGGYVAMSYAAQFPEHPGGLILVNTEAQVDLEAKKEAYAIAIKSLGITSSATPYNELGDDIQTIADCVGEIACEYDKNPSPENFDLFIKFCVPLFSQTPFELTPPYRVNMSIREHFIRNESLSMDLTKGLSEVNCPVLQLAGDRDPTHPAVCAEKTAKCFPKSQYVLFLEAGAPVYQDQASLFFSTVDAFLAELHLGLEAKNR